MIAWRIGGNFYSRPCGRGDPTSQPEPQRRPNFYSRPCGRGDPQLDAASEIGIISTLTPLREGATIKTIACGTAQKVFLLTPLAEGATWRYVEEEAWNDYFYSRPCGEGRPVYLRRATAGRRISTHAPAEGRLLSFSTASRRVDDFYSRPCGRGDGTPHFGAVLPDFISTHAPAERGDSARRAAATSSPAFPTHAPAEGRHNRIPNRMMVSYFYSRPCGATIRTFTRNHIIHVISTHAPAEGDLGPENRFAARHISTHAPAGGRRHTEVDHTYQSVISTHAP